MAWIESHQSLDTHPKLYRLSLLSGYPEDYCIGKLHRLWWWALKYAEDGNLSRYSFMEIGRGIKIENNGDAEKFFVNLRESGWLDPDNYIHDWWDYAGRFLQVRYKHYPEKWKRIKELYERRKNSSKNGSKGSSKGSSKNYKPNQPNQPTAKEVLKPKTQEFLASYCNSFKEIYGENPVILPKHSGIAKRLVTIPGIDMIMKAFFESRDEFIVKNCHALHIVESQINKLKVKGKANTAPKEPSTLDKIKKEMEAQSGQHSAA